MPIRFALAAILAAAALPAAAVTVPSSIVVFGDSLVDAGNIDIAVGSDIFNPQAKGYYPGRFNNGFDYTDLLSERLYGALSRPSLAGGSNYAFGGARIVNDGDAVPDLALQLGSYFTKTSNVADPNALYIINAGGNDVFGIEQGKIGSFASNALYTTALLDTLSGTIQALTSAGAKRILVTGIPNVDATGMALDVQVQARLDSITPGLGSTQLLRFSYQNFFIGVTTNPAAYGLPPFTQAGNCIDQGAVGGIIDCTGYFSFDGIHPTAAVQGALYTQILGLTGLDAVPEPATWAMLLAGFGFVGTAMRRKAHLAAA